MHIGTSAQYIKYPSMHISLVLHFDNSLAKVLSFEQSQEGIEHLVKPFSNSFFILQFAL